MEKQHYTEIEIIRKTELGSIKDQDVILSLVKYCNANPGNNDLLDKIDPRFSYIGLYPHVMKSFDLLPDFLKKENDEKKL